MNDDDRFEEVNVRSRQPVPEGESSLSQNLPQQKQPPQSCGSEDRRIGDSTERDESKSASTPKAKFVSSRQVYSHEETPCGSVNYVTSPTIEDPRFDSGKENDGKGQSVGVTGKNSTAKTTTITDDGAAKTKLDLNSSVIAVEGDEQAQSDSITRKPSKDLKRPKSHQQSQSRASLQHQQLPSSNKPRPKSLPKSTDSQDDSPAYDVSLSKMASETHRFISEGVAAAAAAAVDAVLTHTAVAAAAGKDGIGGPAAATSLSKESPATSSTPSAGRKVKPGYGVYQPPRRRGESLDENVDQRPS